MEGQWSLRGGRREEPLLSHTWSRLMPIVKT